MGDVLPKHKGLEMLISLCFELVEVYVQRWGATPIGAPPESGSDPYNPACSSPGAEQRSFCAQHSLLCASTVDRWTYGLVLMYDQR